MSQGDSDARVAHAIQTCMGALNTLSNRETALVLKALGGMNNFVVQAPAQIAAQRQGQNARAQSARSSNSGKASSTPNPANKDPKVQEMKEALRANSSAIKAELKKLNLTGKDDKLPEDHPLVLEREQFNIALKSFRDQVTMSVAEETSAPGKGKSPSTAQSAVGGPSGSSI
jgi:hypothetical protein